MSKTIIFSGAGFHAIDCIDRWLAEGFNGVCFAEIDKSKHYKRLGGLEISPLDKPIKQLQCISEMSSTSLVEGTLQPCRTISTRLVEKTLQYCRRNSTSLVEG